MIRDVGGERSAYFKYRRPVLRSGKSYRARRASNAEAGYTTKRGINDVPVGVDWGGPNVHIISVRRLFE